MGKNCANARENETQRERGGGGEMGIIQFGRNRKFNENALQPN